MQNVAIVAVCMIIILLKMRKLKHREGISGPNSPVKLVIRVTVRAEVFIFPFTFHAVFYVTSLYIWV